MTAFATRRRPLIAQINITPLVDVMLVLLVIFMVTAPMIQQGVSVQLPKATTGPLPSEQRQLLVAIAGDGGVYFNDAPISIEELSRRLQPLFQAQPEQAIRLRADKRVPYGRVAEVMAAVRNAGARKIGMVTEPVAQERQ
jgi:biopolymer transport protein TolR